MTHLIVVLQKMLGVPEVISELLAEVREKHAFEHIVDIGSGSGGAIMPAVKQYNEQNTDAPLKLTLTDLNPHPDFVSEINGQKDPNIQYRSGSTDARHLEQAPEGLKTMMNSFHHMPPSVARDILLSAQDAKQPILIYEMAENKVPLLLWWLFLPLGLLILILMTWFMTPAVKPLTAKQLLFTYLIPVIPIGYAWDGQVSNVRMYTEGDLDELLDGHRSDAYTWSYERPKNKKGKSVGYYILGLPKT